MSDSLSSHMNGGAREPRNPAVGEGMRPHSTVQPGPTGALPAVPALHEALARAHPLPNFLASVSRLLTTGGEASPHILWRAVHDLLTKGPDGREEIAWDIVGEICRQSKLQQHVRNAIPPVETIAELVVVSPDNHSVALTLLTDNLPVDPLRVLESLSANANAPVGARGLAFDYIQKNYATLIRDAGNLTRIAEFIRDAVMRHDPKGLEASLFVRDRYEESRAWVGKEAESGMLWLLRDQLTATLLEVPERCEANLKIALMYPHEVPHAALQREPQRLTEDERWILSEARYLREALGNEFAQKIDHLDAKGYLDSSYFVYMGPVDTKPFRGVLSFSSRFDRDRSVLIPLARALELEVAGLDVRDSQREQLVERPPRTWINREERMLYQAAQVAQACRCVEEHYWKPEVSDRMRHNAREFLRTIIRERSGALSLAMPSVRESGAVFYSEMLRLARDEALKVWRAYPEASGENQVIRNAVIVLNGFGVFSVDVHRLALEELALALRNPTETMMCDPAFVDFIVALRPSCQTSTSLEARASRAIMNFPVTLGASHLARTLAEARGVSEELHTTIAQQACRNDLNHRIWLNYAHSALLCDVDDDIRQRMREVLDERYDLPVRALCKWSPKNRASYRALIGDLYPHRVGEVTPVRHVFDNLYKSPLESLVWEALAQIPDLSVQTGRYISWAPAIDGVVTTTRPGVPAIVVLIDGEKYHSVNGLWSFRGFDGHSLLATKIIRRAGYPVLRISGQMGDLSEHDALRSAVSSAIDYLAHGGEVQDPRLVVDPDADFKEIAGKVLLYRPVVEDWGRHLTQNPCSEDTAAEGMDTTRVREGRDEPAPEDREVAEGI